MLPDRVAMMVLISFGLYCPNRNLVSVFNSVQCFKSGKTHTLN
jgi:hypothetical protein